MVILSDTHLGRCRGGVRSVEALRPLWQGARRLIINGDLAEVHDASLRGHAARLVLQLEQCCEADGIEELTLLSGNHDPLISDRRYLNLFGGEVFVTHGDVLHRAISPWTGHARRLAQLHSEALAAADKAGGDGFDDRFAAAQYAAHFQWDEFVSHPDPPRGPLERQLQRAMKFARVLWYWRTLPRAAAAFARWHVPHCRYFIFGHIHRAGIWADQDRLIINTGAYGWPGRPHAVVIDDGELSVWPVHRGDTTYRLAAEPRGRFQIYNRAAA